MTEGALEKCLTNDVTPEQWFEILNGRALGTAALPRITANVRKPVCDVLNGEFARSCRAEIEPRTAAEHNRRTYANLNRDHPVLSPKNRK
jgi:hypothetical protein